MSVLALDRRLTGVGTLVARGKEHKEFAGRMYVLETGLVADLSIVHAAKDGTPKVLAAFDLPLTGKNCVNLIITDLAVFDVTPEGIKLIEIAPGVTLKEINAKTAAKYTVAATWRKDC
jgi:3-oxoacid CoA-transferase subunit B